MSFNIDISADLGKALIEWEERLISVYQVWNHSRLMIETLNQMQFKKSAHAAGGIYLDINQTLKSGELMAKLARIHAEEHPCLHTSVGSEMLRQFTNVMYPYLFTEMDEERKEVLSALMDNFLEAAREAVVIKVVVQ